MAPWIGTALGLSDKTVDAVKHALGGATPEQMLALKQADQSFALQMQELGFKQLADLEAIAAGDRKDARALQSATRSAVPAILSGIVTLGYFGILVGLLKGWLTVNASSEAMLPDAGLVVHRLGCRDGLLVWHHSGLMAQDRVAGPSVGSQGMSAVWLT